MRQSLIVGSLLVVLLLAQSALATGIGEILIRTNTQTSIFTDKIVRCGRNYIEIWIKNDAPLYGISVSIELSMPSDTFSIIQPFGTLPINAPILEVAPGPDATAFDLGLGVNRQGNRIYIEGAALNQPLTVHPYFTRLYTIHVSTGAGEDFLNGFCVDNIPHFISGKWMFRDEAEYAPLFNGVANNSVTDPSAPPACFEVFNLPCGNPTYTSTPTLPITLGLCDTFTFDFDATWDFCPFSLIWFDAAVGTITSPQGLYRLAPDGQDGPQVDTVFLHGDGACGAQPFVVTVDRTNAAPTIATCKPIMRVQMGTTREIHHQIADADICDSHSWSLELLSGTPPTFPVSAPDVGVVSVDATAVTDSASFSYRLLAVDANGLPDSCMTQLRIVDFKPGDANGDALITISDVVYIIPWLFGGGEIPEPLRSRMDADGNGHPSISDAVYLINYIFVGGPEPC